MRKLDAFDAAAPGVSAAHRLEMPIAALAKVIEAAAAGRARHGRALTVADGEGMGVAIGRVEHRERSVRPRVAAEQRRRG
jgi:hypothetical protein